MRFIFIFFYIGSCAENSKLRVKYGSNLPIEVISTNREYQSIEQELPPFCKELFGMDKLKKSFTARQINF